MTNYPPKIHQENNFQNVLKLIEQFPLATLICAAEDDILISHIPLMYIPSEKSYGKLVGHMDKNNPQWKSLEKGKLKIIFHGPDCYISPSYYKKKNLPSWNYLIAHLDGTCRLMDSTEEVKKSMVEMTEELEKKVSRYRLSMNDPKMNKLINYVVGFEVEITDWEGKFKISQDKEQKDFLSAKQKLKEKAQQEMNGFIDSIFENHQNQDKKY